MDQKWCLKVSENGKQLLHSFSRKHALNGPINEMAMRWFPKFSSFLFLNKSKTMAHQFLSLLPLCPQSPLPPPPLSLLLENDAESGRTERENIGGIAEGKHSTQYRRHTSTSIAFQNEAAVVFRTCAPHCLSTARNRSWIIESFTPVCSYLFFLLYSFPEIISWAVTTNAGLVDLPWSKRMLF